MIETIKGYLAIAGFILVTFFGVWFGYRGKRIDELEEEVENHEAKDRVQEFEAQSRVDKAKAEAKDANDIHGDGHYTL